MTTTDRLILAALALDAAMKAFQPISDRRDRQDPRDIRSGPDTAYAKALRATHAAAADFAAEYSAAFGK